MGCFRLLAIADNAAMNMELQYLFQSLLLSLFLNFFLKKIFFWPGCGASGILGPCPEIEPEFPELAARGLNH